MAMMPPPEPDPAVRRVVLIDFDWQDADLMPALLRRPGIAVRLVAGLRDDEAGVRVAELCGVPRSIELADLTREIFDLALVSERSRRRSQVERLLHALGTPVASPQGFLESAETQAGGNGASPATPADGEALARLLAEALPDLSLEPAGQDRIENGDGGDSITAELPGPEELRALGRLVARRAAETGAATAELHVGEGGRLKLACRSGPEDPLLEALVEISLASGCAQVVSRLDGPERGRAWGAWPFVSRRHRGVLAASTLDPIEGRAVWETLAQELRVAWEPPRPASAAPPRPGWVSPEDFQSRLHAATERNRTEGTRWALHRLRFDGPGEAIERVCHEIPGLVRESDPICLPGARDVLLLTSGTPEAFAHIRRRLTRAWERIWEEGGEPPPAPPIADEQVELREPSDLESFRTIAGRWISPA